MTYENQAAGTVHNIKVEMRVASGLAQVTFSSAVGATYPLVKLTSVGAQLNPLTTRLTLAGVDVEIANTEAVQQLMAPGYLVQTSLTDAAGLSDLTLKIRPGGAAALTAALGVFPYGLHIGAESVLVMGAVAGADFDTLTVARAVGLGHFKTDAMAHPAGTPCGASPQTWPGRLVSEVLVYPNGDERLVALYACDGIPSYRDGVWSFPMQDGLGFYNRTVGRGMGNAKVLNGNRYGVSNSQGLLIQGTRFAVEDSLVPGTYHLNPSGFKVPGNDEPLLSIQPAGQATGFVPAGAPADVFFWPIAGNLGPIVENLPAVGDELEPRIILRSTASNLILALLNSVKGNGANGPWDVIRGNDETQTGAGIPAARINSAAIMLALDGMPTMEITLEPGALLLDVIEQELAWLGLFLDIDADGLVTLREILYPVSTQNCDHQLTDASLHASASEELRISGRLVHRVTLKADFDAVEMKHRLTMNLPGALTTENQLGEAVVFAPTWLPFADDLLLLEQYQEQLGDVVSRWGVPRPEFALEHDWTQHLVRVGDTAGVINPRLPDSLGGQGVALGCLVTAVESDLEAGLVRITAEAVGSSRGGYFCPAGEILNVAPAGANYSLTLTAAAASRLVSGLREAAAPADEAEYFAPGWAIAGYAYTTGAIAWTGEVVAVAGAVLTVSATLPPVVTELVAPNTYGTFGSAPATMPALDAAPSGNRRPGLQPDASSVAYLWLADAAHTLGPGADDPKEWI